MNKLLVLILLVCWIFLAYRAFARGDTTTAIALFVFGIALAAFRLRNPKT